MRKNLTMERVMKKLLTLLTLTIVLLSFGCKKDAEQTATQKIIKQTTKHKLHLQIWSHLKNHYRF